MLRRIEELEVAHQQQQRDYNLAVQAQRQHHDQLTSQIWQCQHHQRQFFELTSPLLHEQ